MVESSALLINRAAGRFDYAFRSPYSKANARYLASPCSYVPRVITLVGMPQIRRMKWAS